MLQPHRHTSPDVWRRSFSRSFMDETAIAQPVNACCGPAVVPHAVFSAVKWPILVWDSDMYVHDTALRGRQQQSARTSNFSTTSGSAFYEDAFLSKKPFGCFTEVGFRSTPHRGIIRMSASPSACPGRCASSPIPKRREEEAVGYCGEAHRISGRLGVP